MAEVAWLDWVSLEVWAHYAWLWCLVALAVCWGVMLGRAMGVAAGLVWFCYCYGLGTGCFVPVAALGSALAVLLLLLVGSLVLALFICWPCFGA